MKADDWNDTAKRGTLASAGTTAAQAQQAVTRNTFAHTFLFLPSTTVSKMSACTLFAIESLCSKEQHRP